MSAKAGQALGEASGLRASVVEALPAPLGEALWMIAGIALLIGFISLNTMFLIWLERKVCARFQARLGPTRVGPFGLLQPVADAIKLLMKENIRPKAADVFAYIVAPLLPLVGSFLVLAVLPFGKNLQVVDLDAGLLYLSAVSGLGVLGVLMGGWASNSKYSLLGAMRSGAQLFSYELSMVLCLLLVGLASGTTSLQGVVQSQSGQFWDWWIFKLPFIGFIAFVLYLISSTAELNRGPLDLAEAESELTGGFHTEYTGMAFSLFFLAEYINLFLAAALGAVFFLGGYLPLQLGIPGLDDALAFIPGPIWLGLKAYALIFLYMWFRWTFPRLRIDHLLALEWRYILPLSLVNLFLGAAWVTFGWILP
jgi:NADH-quinone oxidoreductase subunit H